MSEPVVTAEEALAFLRHRGSTQEALAAFLKSRIPDSRDLPATADCDGTHWMGVRYDDMVKAILRGPK